MSNKIYSQKILLSMLDAAICKIIENDDCSLCKLCNCKDERCLQEDLCKNFLFDGLYKSAIK